MGDMGRIQSALREKSGSDVLLLLHAEVKFLDEEDLVFFHLIHRFP
jgi:hypothetical protein